MASADAGIIIAIVLAAVIIMIIILLVIFYTIRNRSSLIDSPTTTTTTIEYIPPIWGNNQLIGVCTGYRFPPISSDTPTIAQSNSNVDGLRPFNGGFNCTWSDELNRQLIERTCLQGVCTDDQGNTYQQGETSIFNGICGGTSGRCTGNLGLLPIGRDTNSYNCISIDQNDDNARAAVTCNLNDYNQYMVVDYNGDYLAQILTRDTDYSLTMEGDRVVFRPTPLVNNSGYQWIIIPPMRVRTSGSAVVMEAPPQIGYVGNLPNEVINNADNYRNIQSLRNMIINNSIMTLTYSVGNLVLSDWRLYVPESQTDSEWYDAQAAAYVSINNLSQIPSILSQP